MKYRIKVSYEKLYELEAHSLQTALVEAAFMAMKHISSFWNGAKKDHKIMSTEEWGGDEIGNNKIKSNQVINTILDAIEDLPHIVKRVENTVGTVWVNKRELRHLLESYTV